MFTALLPSSGISSLGPSLPDNSLPDTRIEDGKLLYERRWYGTILCALLAHLLHVILVSH
jgi:hypothetical protein